MRPDEQRFLAKVYTNYFSLCHYHLSLRNYSSVFFMIEKTHESTITSRRIWQMNIEALVADKFLTSTRLERTRTITRKFKISAPPALVQIECCKDISIEKSIARFLLQDLSSIRCNQIIPELTLVLINHYQTWISEVIISYHDYNRCNNRFLVSDCNSTCSII